MKPAPQEASDRPPSPATPEHEGGFRILVVDDDPDMCRYLALVLTSEGLRSDFAEDGESAQLRALSEPPDLIILDVMLPGVSGFDVCRQLKANHATALIPIVLLTALDDHQSRVRGIEAGADDFLSKPVNREELVARVRTLRRLHETRKELEQRRLAAEVARKEEIRKAFSRYVSPRLADRIIGDLGEKEALFTRTQRSSVVALFADLRGFTRFTERIEVLRVVEMLNEYFTVLTEAAYQHEGTIFNMAGDSLLVGFNVPLLQEDAPERAYLCAQEMLARFAPVAARWQAAGDLGASLGLGIGICMGDAIIGNIGSPHYMSYTIIGDPVNTAARLMQLAMSNEVLVCGHLYESIQSLVRGKQVESRGKVMLRGRSEPIPVYSVKIPPAAGN